MQVVQIGGKGGGDLNKIQNNNSFSRETIPKADKESLSKCFVEKILPSCCNNENIRGDGPKSESLIDDLLRFKRCILQQPCIYQALHCEVWVFLTLMYLIETSIYVYNLFWLGLVICERLLVDIIVRDRSPIQTV